MSEKLDLTQNAHRILRAFPVAEIGAEISGRQLVDHFIAENVSAGDCVRAIRHAVHIGWIGLRPENQIVLRDAGVAVLLGEIRDRSQSDDGYLGGQEVTPTR